MGYTHYYYVSERFNQTLFNHAIADFKKIQPLIEGRIKRFQTIKVLSNSARDWKVVTKQAKIKLCGGMCTGEPEINDNVICFNGSNEGDLGHETFCISQTWEYSKYDQKNDNGLMFSFTKTARKPYDLAVCAALIIFKEYFDEKIKVSSDGELSDWQDAIDLVQHKLGYGERFRLDQDEQ